MVASHCDTVFYFLKIKWFWTFLLFIVFIPVHNVIFDHFHSKLPSLNPYISPTESFLLPNKFLLLFRCFYIYDLGSLHEHGVLNWSMDHYITEENDSSSSSSQWLFKDGWDFTSLLVVIMGCWWPLSICEFLGTTTVSCLKAMSCGSPCSYILSTQPPMMFSSKQKFCLLLDVHTSSFVKYLSIQLLPSPHFVKAVLTFYVLELFMYSGKSSLSDTWLAVIFILFILESLSR